MEPGIWYDDPEGDDAEFVPAWKIAVPAKYLNITSVISTAWHPDSLMDIVRCGFRRETKAEMAARIFDPLIRELNDS